jgi:hypothetical protein
MALAAWSMSIIIARWKWATGRLLRPDARRSHVAGQWRKLSPSAELMVDPGRGARCAIRTLGHWRGRYHWTVGLFDRPDPMVSERTGEIGEARRAFA